MLNRLDAIEYDKSEGKAIRLLELYFYIEEYPGIKADRLIEVFGVSPATLYRDIQTLRKLGIPIDVESSNRGGYRIEKGSIRFLRIKPQEIRPLLIARELLFKLTFPQGEIFDRLLKNMLNTIRDGEIARIDNQLKEVLYFRVPLNRRFSMDAKTQVQALSDLLEASVNRWTVELYYPSQKKIQPRRINPYGIWFGHNAWYVAGWCHKHKALRTFAVDRIEKLTVLERETFKRPESFNLPDWVETSWIAMPAVAETAERVVLAFDYDTGMEIAQSFWHQSQEFIVPNKADEPVEATFTLSKTSLETEFLSWVMSFGPKVRVKEPTWFRKRIIDCLEKTRSLYD